MDKNTKVMTTSLITNIFLSLLKIISGIIGSSHALIADGIHSFSDFATDIFAIIGVALANKPADREHPYGHGKFEYLISIFIGIVIIFLGVTIIKNSFQHEIVIPSLLVAIVSFITIIAKWILSSYIIKKGREYESSILIASGKESSSDVISSVVVLISAIMMLLSNKVSIFKYADIIATILVGIFILKVGIEVLNENISTILGQSETDPEYVGKIKNIIMAQSEVQEVDDLVILKFGSCYYLSGEVGMNPNLPLEKAHLILDIIEKNIKTSENKIKYITIHAFPYHKQK